MACSHTCKQYISHGFIFARKEERSACFSIASLQLSLFSNLNDGSTSNGMSQIWYSSSASKSVATLSKIVILIKRLEIVWNRQNYHPSLIHLWAGHKDYQWNTNHIQGCPTLLEKVLMWNSLQYPIYHPAMCHQFQTRSMEIIGRYSSGPCLI